MTPHVCKAYSPRLLIVVSSLLVTLVASAAGAQSIPEVKTQAPFAEPALRKVPAIGVRVGVGATFGSLEDLGPAYTGALMIRLHRSFSLEVAGGWFELRQTLYAGEIFTLTQTDETSFGSAAIAWHVDTRRFSVWAGTGIVGGHTNSEFVGALNGGPQYVRQNLVAIRLTGGIDVPIGTRLGVFAAAGNFGSGTIIEGGARVALNSVTVVPARAARQPMLPSASGLLAHRGDQVWVLEKAGTEHSGQLLDSSTDAIRLLVGGQEIQLPLTSIRLVEKPDGLGNGARWGAIGGGAGMFTLMLLGGYFGGADESPDLLAGLGLTAAGVGIGALAGAGIDALSGGRQVIYRSPSGSTVSVSATVAPSGVCAVTRVRW